MTRRDNGLPASSFVRLRDVETHLVDGLLERLRDESVAAYVAPAAGTRGPYGDTVLPGTPSDSVYVDSDLVAHARSVSDRYLAEVAEELAWAAIVAGYDQPSVDDVPRWPASEDLPDDRTGDSPSPALGDGPRWHGTSRIVRPAAPPTGFGELRDHLEDADLDAAHREDAGWYGDAANRGEVVGAEEHYEPPPPPPLPVPDTVGRFAWAAVIGGPLFLLVSTLFGLDVGGWPGFLALAAFMAGFVTLVARMKDRPDTDLDGDDGAVV